MGESWSDKGCGECRQAALTGIGPPLALRAESIPLHARLYRCQKCGSYWIESERDAHVVGVEEAIAAFGADSVR